MSPDEARVTPQMVVDYVARWRGITVEAFDVAPLVVLSWTRRRVQSLAEATGARMVEHWIYGEQYPLYTGVVGGRRVSFAFVPFGAPGTVMMMEEMIACGARTFIARGAAGSLQPDAPVGTCLIPTECVSDEGTSAHYVGNDTNLSPSLRLLRALQSACQVEGLRVRCGPVWTIDALFRETTSKIEAYRQSGVLGVDMETSAMYALSRFRGIEVCNLLIVSDELWSEWRPAFGQPEFVDAMQRAERAIIRTVAFL